MFHFCEFSEKDQRRFRQIYHMTSADTALRILRSQSIWSTDADQMANFSLNQDPVDQLDEPREVSLGFYFDGPIELISLQNQQRGFEPDVLYIFVTNWPWEPKLKGLEVWAARLVPGSQKHLVCESAVFVRDFNDRAKSNSYARLVQREIQAAVSCKPRIFVPETDAERDQIQGRYPSAKYSLLERIKAWLDIKLESRREDRMQNDRAA